MNILNWPLEKIILKNNVTGELIEINKKEIISDSEDIEVYIFTDPNIDVKQIEEKKDV